jgi:dihydropyrimidinase
MISAGVTSFKVFMAFPDSMVDDAGLLKVLSRAKELGSLVILHAENGAVIDVLTKRALAEGNTSLKYGAFCHPRIAEAEAVNRAIMLARLVETPIYFYHISSEMALAPIKEAQGLGLPVFAETCPHYLFLTEDKYQTPDFEGAKYLCAPPLRDSHDQDALWNALAARNVQVVSSDHVSVNFHGQKDLGRDDFSKILLGMPGVETRLPLLYSAVSARRISLNRFVELTATAPAKLFGVYPKKGTISIGSDADLVIFDPEKELTLSAQTLHQQVDYIPYEGLELRGAPSVVLSKGKVVVQDGTFVGEKGAGQYLSRKLFSSICW